MNYKTLKALVLSIFMGCSVLSTQAQIYVNASATGSNNGSSWNNAFTNLQPALDAAAENAEIRVAAGTYNPTAAPDDSTDDNRNKAFHFDKNLVLKGSYNPVTNAQDFTNPSILSGDFNDDDVITGSGSTLSITNNTENAYHVLITQGLTNAAQIEGFFITGGFANGDGGTIAYSNKNFYNDSGAGIYNDTSSPSIVNTVFSGNVADFGGGGIYNSSSSPSIVNTVFRGNVVDFDGGGIYNDLSSPSIVNTVFIGNSADFGGGGIYNSSSSPSIVNTVFSGNSATSLGGGIYNFFDSSPSIVNTVFSGNVANSGGGIYNIAASPSIVNSTFSGNSAPTGGGIRNNSSSTPTIYNSIFYGNGSDIANNNSSSVTGEHNFSENYAETGFTALDADPFYRSSDPIGSDGIWFTDDDGLKPKIGSSIIDAGDATKLPSDTLDLDGNLDTSEDIPFDIRGRSRVLGSLDVGAYEYDSTVLSVNDIDSSNLDIYSTGYKTLVIHGELNAKTTANVYNLLGKLVASKTFDKFSTSNSLDVSKLPTGIYIVKMYNTNHQVLTKKLFIQ